MTTKREQIERALKVINEYFGNDCWQVALDKLAKQAIVIEAEVEHNEDDGKTWLRRHLMPGVDDLIFYKRGFHGTPGPYLFFGLPREEEAR